MLIMKTFLFLYSLIINVVAFFFKLLNRKTWKLNEVISCHKNSGNV